MTIRSQLKILLVEDNDDHASLITETIYEISSAHSIFRTSNGEEALTYLEEVTDREDQWPDIVMLDMKMPLLNGIETLLEIRRRERHADIPVVIFSTSSSQQEIQAAFEGGANSYMVKPLHFTELTAKIKDFVHYWAEVTETPGFRVDE